MRFKFKLSGNEAIGYQATKVGNNTIHPYEKILECSHRFDTLCFPLQPRLIESVEETAKVVASPPCRENSLAARLTTADLLPWAGLEVSLDLNLDRFYVKPESLRELFTDPDTGEVEKCSLRVGDRCLVEIFQKDWLKVRKLPPRRVFDHNDDRQS